MSRQQPPPHEALTPREKDVLRTMASGATYRDAAALLGMRYDTYKQATATVRYKLGAANRAAAAAYAVRNGLG